MKNKILYIIGSIILLTSIILFNCFVVNPSQLKIRLETIESSKIDESIDGTIIAYFSDIHYKKSTNKLIEKTIESINNYDPDIIIFGGDLIDRLSETELSKNEEDYLIKTLGKLNSKHGKFAVIGNHDHQEYNISTIVSNILEKANFDILNNESASIYINQNNHLNLVGLDSSSFDTLDADKAFNNVDSDAYTIAITHTPDSFNQIINYDFDYCLAGHSHGGQVYIPIINLLTRAFGYQNYLRGKTVKNNKTLDITNGVGTTRYNARLNADSEVVIYRLMSK